MARWRALSSIFMILLLGGCWTGHAFYASADAVQPIEPGEYRVMKQIPPAQPEDSMIGKSIFAHRGDGGTTILGEKDDTDAILLIPVPGTVDRYIGQEAHNEESDKDAIFYLLSVEGMTIRVSMPMCDKTYRIAKKAGAIISNSRNIIRECRFPDRLSLEAAMKHYAERPDNWIEIQRIGN